MTPHLEPLRLKCINTKILKTLILPIRHLHKTSRGDDSKNIKQIKKNPKTFL